MEPGTWSQEIQDSEEALGGSIVADVIKKHRLRLYRSLQAALHDGGRSGWHYERVLLDLQALLDAEAFESGEESSNSTHDTMGSSARGLQNMLNSKIRRQYGNNNAAFVMAENFRGEHSGILEHNRSLMEHNEKLFAENLNLARDLQEAKELLENLQDECLRIHNEEHARQAMNVGLQEDGKAFDSILCKLQEKALKYKKRGCQSQKLLNESQRRLQRIENDFKMLKRDAAEKESRYLKEMKHAEEETSCLRKESMELRMRTDAVDSYQLEYKNTISKLQSKLDASLESERKFKTLSDDNQLEVLKWQHAAEKAANVAEQVKVEMDCLRAEARETSAREDRWKVKFAKQEVEVVHIKNELQETSENSEARSSLLSWTESSILLPLCQFAALQNPPPPEISSSMNGSIPFQLTKSNSTSPTWLLDAFRSLLDNSEKHVKAMTDKEHSFKKKIQLTTKECDARVSDLTRKLKDMSLEKHVRDKNLRKMMKRCEHLTAGRHQLQKEAERLQQIAKLLRQELISLQKNVDAQMKCCSSAMSDAVKTAAQAAFRNGYELKQKELERLKLESQHREEKCQKIAADLGDARKLEIQLQGEKVELEAEVTTQKQQIAQLMDDMNGVKFRLEDSKASLLQNLEMKDKEIQRMDLELKGMVHILKDSDDACGKMELECQEKQSNLENVEKGLQETTRIVGLLREEVEVVKSERDQMHDSSLGVSRALSEKNDALKEAKSKLACLETLVEEKDFMLKKLSDQVQDLSIALESQRLIAAESENASHEALQSAQITANAVDSNVRIIKEMRQRLIDLELMHEEKMAALQRASKLELETCQNGMRAQLEATQAKFELLQSKHHHLKEWIDAMDGCGIPRV